MIAEQCTVREKNTDRPISEAENVNSMLWVLDRIEETVECDTAWAEGRAEGTKEGIELFRKGYPPDEIQTMLSKKLASKEYLDMMMEKNPTSRLINERLRKESAEIRAEQSVTPIEDKQTRHRLERRQLFELDRVDRINAAWKEGLMEGIKKISKVFK